MISRRVWLARVPPDQVPASVKASYKPRENDRQSPFRFLDLPPEIRHIIYSYHFAPAWPAIAVPCISKPKSLSAGIKRPRYPALMVLETCRQIY